jgi:hypothetical protein
MYQKIFSDMWKKIEKAPSPERGGKMPTKETNQLAPAQEAAAVERYIPREWTTDPDFAVHSDRHGTKRDWFSRMLGWLAAR